MIGYDVWERGQGMMSTEMEQLDIEGDAYRQVMAILVILPFPAGFSQ